MSHAELVARLGLLPHPEGGFYREIHRSEDVTPTARGPRSQLTAIHFLLPAGTFSAWHAVSSEEVWVHTGGDAVRLHQLGPEGATTHVLAASAADGPVTVVPSGRLQAAEADVGPHGYALCACMVAPGFDFADFTMPDRATLRRDWPDHEALITRFTRER